MKKMVYVLPRIEVPKQLCEECCIARQTRKPFKHDLPMKSHQKLEIVHSNVCSPFEVKLV